MITWPGSERGNDVLEQLSAEGVALWLEDFHRGRLADGSLERLVADGLVVGVVSRPAAIARAMADSSVYQDQLTGLSATSSSAEERVRHVVSQDARDACAVLEPVFRGTNGMQGWVSLAVASPAGDAQALTAHVRGVVEMVGRPNLLIRLPAVDGGLAAAADLLADGIAVHVTSVFSVRRYAQAVDAYFRGLERFVADGRHPAGVTSVVSMDVDHLDAAVDALLEGAAAPRATALRGQAGVATARLLYRRYEESLGRPRWRSLVAAGARPQRLLWTSENAQDHSPAALDRVRRLVAWMTLHALPQPALEALSRHEGFRGDTLSGQQDSARRVTDALGRAGVVLDSLGRDLEVAAEQRERAAWEHLLRAVQGW
ncbi:transaldolase family protein [Streptomyces sp. NPDC002734]|uniref:transaldolase family protein n=1 Tax=Streptomyces sp. NPDC002734 TaxID=3154426 RepID=UPI00331E36FD